jgi:hypothetical protein
MDIEIVVTKNEASPLGDRGQRPVEAKFKLGGELHVDDHAALCADQMMVMMPSQRFSEFKASVVRVVDDAPDNPCVGQDRQISVGRTLRKVGSTTEEFRKGQRPGTD